jgi:hypothetical protein
VVLYGQNIKIFYDILVMSQSIEGILTITFEGVDNGRQYILCARQIQNHI